MIRVVCHTTARAEKLIAALARAGFGAHKWQLSPTGCDVMTLAPMRTVRRVIQETFPTKE